MSITLTRRERGERTDIKPEQHKVGWERLPDGRLQVRCSAGDLSLTLDAQSTPTHARRYGDEHRGIVKRIAELEARDREAGRIH